MIESTSIVRAREMLYLLEFKIPEGLEFEQVQWQELVIPDDNQSNFFLRQTCGDFDQLPVLAKFCKELRDYQDYLLEYMWKDSMMFQSEWAGCTYDKLKANAGVYCELCKDLPGFETGIHLDARASVTAGMVFFNLSQTEEKSTTFYNDCNGNHPMVMPCAVGQGWYSSNNPYSWHSGANHTNDIRYSIKFGHHLTMPY
jgi:hypothetical protein